MLIRRRELVARDLERRAAVGGAVEADDGTPPGAFRLDHGRGLAVHVHAHAFGESLRIVAGILDDERAREAVRPADAADGDEAGITPRRGRTAHEVVRQACARAHTRRRTTE